MSESQFKRGTLTWLRDGSRIEGVGAGIGIGGPNYRFKEPMVFHSNVLQMEISAIPVNRS